MKSWFLAFFLAIIALVPVALLYYHSDRNTANKTIEFGQDNSFGLKIGTEYTIKACKVLDGHRYEICLESGLVIQVQLAVVSKQEAAPVVVNLLNTAVPPAPSIILLRKIGDCWVVAFRFTMDGKRLDMADALRARGLLF